MDTRVKQIELIRENHKRLFKCSLHNFVETSETTGKVYCSRCGGYTSLEGAYWYKLGLKHKTENSKDKVAPIQS